MSTEATKCHLTEIPHTFLSSSSAVDSSVRPLRQWLRFYEGAHLSFVVGETLRHTHTVDGSASPDSTFPVGDRGYLYSSLSLFLSSSRSSLSVARRATKTLIGFFLS